MQTGVKGEINETKYYSTDGDNRRRSRLCLLSAIVITLVVLWFLGLTLVSLWAVFKRHSSLPFDVMRKTNLPQQQTSQVRIEISNMTADETFEQNARWSVATPKCHIPALDPWHVSVKEYINLKPPMDCKEIFSKNSRVVETKPKGSVNRAAPKIPPSGTLSYVQDNRLFFANKAIERGVADPGACCYRSIERSKENDDDLDYSDKCEPIVVINPTHLTLIGYGITDELIQIECEALNYTNVHAFMVHDPIEETGLRNLAISKLDPDRYYNVLMVGIDTVSRLNAIRQLPKTLTVLRDLFNTTEFFGYNKVGENTFPNLIPLLTGLTPEQLVQVTCWATNYTQESEHGDDFLDNCKYLWNYYQQSGYVTYYSEDWPKASTFDYLKPGFKQKPTAFYGRPFTLAREKLLYPYVGMGCSSCHLDEPIVRIDLGNLKNFVETHNNMPHLAFHWINCPQHDDLNGASEVDTILARFFTELHNITYNDRTFVIFFSDHGYRWNNFVSTRIGHYESSLPLLTIAPPAAFLDEHPEEYATLVANTRALITPFNMFHTLIQILEMGQKDSAASRPTGKSTDGRQVDPKDLVTIGKNLYQLATASPQTNSITGDASTETTTVDHLRILDGLSYPHNITTYSLFDRRVRGDRSCIEAGIPDNYCVCHTFEQVLTNASDVLAAAYYLVYVHIADKISHSLDICEALNLKSITKAEVFDFRGMKASKESSKKRRRGLTFSLEENGTLSNNTIDTLPSDLDEPTQSVTTTQPPVQQLELSKLNKYHGLPNREYNLLIETQPGGGSFQEVVRFYGDNIDKCKDAARRIRPDIEDPGVDYVDKIGSVIAMDKSCEFSVHSDSISRLNLYGTQSRCVKNNIELKKVCYCKSQTAA